MGPAQRARPAAGHRRPARGNVEGVWLYLRDSQRGGYIPQRRLCHRPFPELNLSRLVGDCVSPVTSGNNPVAVEALTERVYPLDVGHKATKVGSGNSSISNGSTWPGSA